MFSYSGLHSLFPYSIENVNLSDLLFFIFLLIYFLPFLAGIVCHGFAFFYFFFFSFSFSFFSLLAGNVCHGFSFFCISFFALLTGSVCHAKRFLIFNLFFPLLTGSVCHATQFFIFIFLFIFPPSDRQRLSRHAIFNF